MSNRILIVDDEESLARVIKMNLEDSGRYEVRIETKGSHALAAAIEFKPDLVFLDFIMPDLNGSDVAYALRENESTKNIPIVFLTAVAVKKDMRQHGRIIDGRQAITKPVSTEEIIQTIEAILGSGS